VTVRVRVASRCAVQPDPGYGRSRVDACWATPDTRFVGVASGFSPEPTLLRSDLAERTANLVCTAMVDEWMRDRTSDVEARLRGVFEAVNQRVRDQACSVVEWPEIPARRRWPWRRRTEASPPGRTVFRALAHVAALVIDGDAVYVAHMGACRVFARRERAWSQLTQDHIHSPEFSWVFVRALGLDFADNEPTIARHSIDEAPFLVCTESFGLPVDMDPESMLATYENSQGALVIIAASQR
jgi:hypothetical protein